MARTQMPITGHTRGKYGPAVFSVQFGKNTMRPLPDEVKDAKTEKQLTQRAKFKAGMEYNRLVLEVIQTGWKEEAIHQSAFNAATSYTVKNALQQVGGVWVIDPTKVMHAKGTLSKAKDLAATNPSGQTIISTWVDNSGMGGNASPDDTFNYVYVNTTNNEVEIGFTTQKRSDQTYSYSAPADWTGNDVAVYGFFTKADGTIVSDDTYIATLTLH